MSTVQTFRKGDILGVNVNGKPAGHATRVKDDIWTAFVPIPDPPFDVARPGLTEQQAIDLLVRNAEVPCDGRCNDWTD